MAGLGVGLGLGLGLGLKLGPGLGLGLGLEPKHAPARSPLVRRLVVGQRLALQREHPKVPG